MRALDRGLASRSGEARPYASRSGEAKQAKLDSATARLQDRAVKEITKRIDSLNALIPKIQALKHVSDASKTTLVSSVQSQVAAMQALLTKIQGDTDLATLKTDVQSITKAYRIYWVFIPQTHVLAAVDRINEVVTLANNVVSKLQARITAGGSATSSLQTTLDDAKAKLADATTQAQNAQNLVSGLKPDNGDTAVQQSNTAALKQAKSDIQAAMADLSAARKDFRMVVEGLKKTRTQSSSLDLPETQ